MKSADEIRKFLDKPISMCKYCVREIATRNGIKWEMSKKEIDEWVEK